MGQGSPGGIKPPELGQGARRTLVRIAPGVCHPASERAGGMPDESLKVVRRVQSCDISKRPKGGPSESALHLESFHFCTALAGRATVLSILLPTSRYP